MAIKIKNNCLLLESGVDIPDELPKLEAQTIVPSTEDQIIPAGYYLAGDQTVLGDPNLIPENIRAGETIFGVTGTYEGETGGGDEPETEGDYSGTLSFNEEETEAYLFADADIENCTISNLLVKLTSNLEDGLNRGQITEVRNVVLSNAYEGTATATIDSDSTETVEVEVEIVRYIHADRYDAIKIKAGDYCFYGEYTWQFNATKNQ